MCTHKVYKILEGIIVISFFITCALYRASLDAEAKGFFWDGIGFYIALVSLDYLMNLVALGYDPRGRNRFILDTAICLYLITAYSLRRSHYIFEEKSE